MPRRAEGYDDLGVVLGSFTAGVHASAEYLETYLRQGAGASPAILFSNTVGNAAGVGLRASSSACAARTRR